MWLLIKSELKYNGLLICAFLALLPLLFLIELNLENAPRFFILMLAFMLQLYYVMFRNKEKRENQQARLPLSAHQIGSARILIIILAGALILVIYSMIGLYFEYNKNIPFTINLKTLILYLAALSIGFSIYFILRDLFLDRLRHNSIYPLTPERSKMMLVFLALFLNVLGIFAMMTQPRIIGTIVGFFFESKPDALDVSSICLFVAALALLTVPTYIGRKSYIE